MLVISQNLHLTSVMAVVTENITCSNTRNEDFSNKWLKLKNVSFTLDKMVRNWCELRIESKLVIYQSAFDVKVFGLAVESIGQCLVPGHSDTQVN